MAMADYKFYMQRVRRDGSLIDASPIDIESMFDGLRYRSCTGLNSVGAPKNIYMEDYPEADGPRVHHPSDSGESVSHKETTIKLNLVFTNPVNYRPVYDAFLEYIREGRIYYWDTARYKKVLLILNSATEPREDIVKGVRYIDTEFSFTNIWGMGKTCDDNGTLK